MSAFLSTAHPKFFYPAGKILFDLAKTDLVLNLSFFKIEKLAMDVVI